MQRFFTASLLDYLVELIQTNFPDLRTVSKGDLSMLPFPEDLATAAPGIIIQPGAFRVAPTSSTCQAFDVVYPFRLFYFRVYDPGDAILPELVSEVEPIAELLMDNFLLPGFEQDNCMGAHGFPTRVDYAAAEDEVLRRTLQLPISIVPIDYEVYTQTRR